MIPENRSQMIELKQLFTRVSKVFRGVEISCFDNINICWVELVPSQAPMIYIPQSGNGQGGEESLVKPRKRNTGRLGGNTSGSLVKVSL